MTALSLSKDLDAWRTAAHAEIDAAAETARLRYITTGSGQAMEYQQTFDEAQTIQSDASPEDTDYPMLVAERDAQVGAGGTEKTLATIAGEVLTEAAAWNAAGKAIKQVRRQYKLLVTAATTPAAIETQKAAGIVALDAI